MPRCSRSAPGCAATRDGNPTSGRVTAEAHRHDAHRLSAPVEGGSSCSPRVSLSDARGAIAELEAAMAAWPSCFRRGRAARGRNPEPYRRSSTARRGGGPPDARGRPRRMPAGILLAACCFAALLRADHGISWPPPAALPDPPGRCWSGFTSPASTPRRRLRAATPRSCPRRRPRCLARSAPAERIALLARESPIAGRDPSAPARCRRDPGVVGRSHPRALLRGRHAVAVQSSWCRSPRRAHPARVLLLMKRGVRGRGERAQLRIVPLFGPSLARRAAGRWRLIVPPATAPRCVRSAASRRR